VPGAEVAEDILDHADVVNDSYDAHRAAANRTAERVHRPDALVEARPERFGRGREIVPVRHGRQHLFDGEPGSGPRVLLVTRGAEPVALAGKGQRVFVSQKVAADASEATPKPP
jgi:hypothetical protein